MEGHACGLAGWTCGWLMRKPERQAARAAAGVFAMGGMTQVCDADPGMAVRRAGAGNGRMDGHR